MHGRVALFSNDFAKQVDRHFRFLIALDFDPIESVTADSFDNGYAIFQSHTLMIQIVRDRSEWSYEIGMPGGLRFDHQLLLELLEGRVLARSEAEKLAHDPAALAVLLERQLPDLETPFSPEREQQTVRTLRRLGEERADRLFGWRPGGERAT